MSESARRVTVLVVDDHALFRQGVSNVLADDQRVRVVGGAASGEEALRLAATERPDIILLDIGLPDVDGIEVARRIPALSPDSHVVFLTMAQDTLSIEAAIEAGASGYLLKDAEGDEVVGAVLAASEGRTMLSATAAECLVEGMRAERRRMLDSTRSDLSEREIEVLRLIADGLSNAEIAGKLFVTTRTVKYHVTNILKKLGVRDRAHAADAGRIKGLLR